MLLIMINKLMIMINKLTQLKYFFLTIVHLNSCKKLNKNHKDLFMWTTL